MNAEMVINITKNGKENGGIGNGEKELLEVFQSLWLLMNIDPLFWNPTFQEGLPPIPLNASSFSFSNW
jgi:hypothetical protein